MKRRNFLLLAGAGVVAIATPTWYFNFYEPVYDPLLAEPEMLSYIWDNETIEDIGKAYLQKFPAEDTKKSLVKFLSPEISSDSNHISEMLNKQIKEDFTNNRIVMLDGWFLSFTETRQCALFSLTQQK